MVSEEQARAFCAARCDAAAMARLEQFVAMLAEENGRQNLVSSASLARVWERHIADSLQLLDHVPRETGGAWLDLGTGAGFPGLAIALARPDQQFVLVESRKRRVEFLERVVHHCGLTKCLVRGARLENVETFCAAVISARAFAPMGRLIDLAGRFASAETLWLLPKGRSGAQELALQTAQVQGMFHVEPSRTDAEAGIILGRGRP